MELPGHVSSCGAATAPTLGVIHGPLTAEHTIQPAVITGVGQLPRRRARRRYWSIRDLSRRLWLGRGYHLLRELVRSGILPSARSSRSWWVEDVDVAGLLAAYDSRAGKVRGFRGLEPWLRERCYVVAATPDVTARLRSAHAGLVWHGAAYLPKAAWQAEVTLGGPASYVHTSGARIPHQAGRAA